MDTRLNNAISNLHKCLDELQEGVEAIYKVHEDRLEHLNSRVAALENECARNHEVLKSVAKLIMEELN